MPPPSWHGARSEFSTTVLLAMRAVVPAVRTSSTPRRAIPHDRIIGYYWGSARAVDPAAVTAPRVAVYAIADNRRRATGAVDASTRGSATPRVCVKTGVLAYVIVRYERRGAIAQVDPAAAVHGATTAVGVAEVGGNPIC